MPTDSELREMALEIIDMTYLRLIDEMMFLTKIDRSVGLADHDSASRYGLSRRLEAIDFGTPPPGSVRGTPERHGANGFVKCVFVTKCIVIALLYPCKTVLLSRSTLYVKNVIREGNKGVCAHHLRPSLPRRQRDFP
jgi:hypothetical protein